MTPRGAKKRWLDGVALQCAPERQECLIFPFPLDLRGYGNFQDAQRRTVMAHIYVCEAAHGARPSVQMHAAHSCGIRKCVNPWHLRWATPAENEADKLAHGTHNKGERQGASRLKSDLVIAIRSRIDAGECQRNLAAEFDVSEQAISGIKHRRIWSWL